MAIQEAQKPETTSDVYKAILDSVPYPIFLVGQGGIIMEYNTAAAAFCGPDRSRVIARRGGEALNCVHARETPGGCGCAQACKNCVVRNSVDESLSGNKISRRRHKAEISAAGSTVHVEMLVTTSPVEINGTRYVSLVLEDISDITTLRTLIPICSKCKKIRDDDAFWDTLEVFFKKQLGVDFTHAYCPECLEETLHRIDKIIP